jgi:sugar O-acyltransferase (sialic acid O-acetyltransferase NeuD family)
MSRPLYVFGAGGHGKVVAEAVLRANPAELRGFLDDDPRKRGSEVLGRPVVGDLESWASLETDAVLALGVGANPSRLRALRRARERGIPLATVVHPSAVVSTGVAIGEGSYVGPGAVIHVEARLGAACIVNSLALVEHDCVLGDGVHVSPQAALGGGVQLGEGVHLGLGAVVLPGLVVGAAAVIGAGSVVTRSVAAGEVVWGSPARVRRTVSSREGS